MPSSYADSFPPIVKVLQHIEPRRVLDIGPGWGKYGLACREYLPAVERVDAIEVPEGRMAVQDAIYNQVYTGDVRRWVNPEFFGRYDLVLLVDVIEHMAIEDGHRLLTRAMRGAARVLVSTPKLFFEQHDEHNPHEEHLSLWTWEEFANRYRVAADASTIDSIIYLLEAP